MLAKIEIYNKEAEPIKKEGKEKLLRKLMCEKRDGHSVIVKCGKLWMKKRLATKGERDEGIEEDECIEDDDSEMIR